MGISIGYDFNKKEFLKEKEHKINQDEFNILFFIINEFKNKFSVDDFEIVSNTDDYLTLKYKKFDFVRVKFTERTKWISIKLSKNDSINNYDNPLFEMQKNKNQMQWKSKLITSDIKPYIVFIENSLYEFDSKTK